MKTQPIEIDLKTLMQRLLDTWLAPLREFDNVGDPLTELRGYIRRKLEMARVGRAREAGADVGDDILTTGGIYGTIAEADGDDIVVELGEGLSVHMTRRGIAAVLPPEEDEVEEDADGDGIEDELADDLADADVDELRARESAV